ncbi:hypothetical protein GQ457_10G014350 [Hibiscus cannabinus]
MQSGETIAIYLSRVMTVTNKMRMFSDKLKDIIIIEKMLRSLTPKFNFVVYAIEEPKILMNFHLMSCKIEDEEDEEEVESKAKKAMIVASNNIFSVKKINFKEEVEKEEVITRQLIKQSLQTNPMWNAVDLIGKSEAFDTFKAYKVLVEKEAANPIKVLCTDRGGEYISQEFTKFCENHGIKRQLTTSFTPQQNGVCEWKNRTILNVVRSLLLRSGILKSFWPKAVNWYIHILNRSPTLVVTHDIGGSMDQT